MPHRKCSAEDEDVFSRLLVTRLIDTLENRPIPHLTPNEQAHLLVLLQTTLEVGRALHLSYQSSSMRLD